MASSIPKTTKQWIVTGTDWLQSLEFSEANIPPLGDSQVLVKIQGASLNYRDIAIVKGTYPGGSPTGFVPGSDGAGTVLAVGKDVQRFKPGDRVVTLFNQGHLGGPADEKALQTGLGRLLDGTFRTVGAFNEQGLVRLPDSLNFIEGSTLTCAGLTAWNALFGLIDKKLLPGQYVLTQGTGGVSLFALQFAKAVGAKVIATTSSEEKAKLLRKLGADHIINYNETPDWGAAARALTPEGAGVDHILEVVGASSMAQSLAAIKVEGVISIIGFVGGAAEKEPGFLECLMHTCVVRGIHVGSRLQLEEMCRAIEANPDALRPVVDQKVFSLDQLKEAYAFLVSAKHQGKVGISIE